jgi:hypothetical protein
MILSELGQLIMAAGLVQQQAAAAVDTPNPVSAFRAAMRRLDECLIANAERLANTDLTLTQRYVTYFQTCPAEKAAAFELAIRPVLDASRPFEHQERYRAFDLRARHINERAKVWVTFLDRAPPNDSRNQ